MEIHGNTLLLSAQDIHRAHSGADSLGDAAFSEYTILLLERLASHEPPKDETEDLTDDLTVEITEPLRSTVACISIPYSVKVVEMLALAISRGAQEEAETSELVAKIRHNLPRQNAVNAARYKAE